jgi:hypothetical protein
MAFSGRKNDRSLVRSTFATRLHQRAPVVATPSPRWKENLRRACLDRARQKRRDLVMRKRRQLSFSGAFVDSARPAQSVVEEELRKMGVGIVSSCPHEDAGAATAPFSMSREDHISIPMLSQDVEDVEGGRQDVEYSMDIDKDTSDFVEYVITEDDLNDILRDVEEELRLDGNHLVFNALNLQNPITHTDLFSISLF